MTTPFESPSMRIKRKVDACEIVFTDIECELCGKKITEKANTYSMRKWGKPYCYGCQGLMSYDKESD